MAAPAPPGPALLDPVLLARLGRLAIGSGRRLAGRFSGEHRSPRYGSSLDFADYREYHPGDDDRRIDYAVYARTDQLFVRLFEAEDDLALRLLVDRSGSMGFGAKLEMAARLAGALGFIALTRRDVVTLETFPPAAPPRRFTGPGTAPGLLAALAELDAAGGSDLDGATAGVLARTGPAGLTVVLSDLLTPTWEAAVDRLPSGRGETAFVHVLATDDVRPALTGDLDVEDVETGERVTVSLSHDARERFTSATDVWLDDVAARCGWRGASYTRVMADDDLEAILFRAWRRLGLLR